MRYLALIVKIVFFVVPAWSMNCGDFISKGNSGEQIRENSPPHPTLFKREIIAERDRLVQNLEKLTAGEISPSDFPLTPENREVSIVVFLDRDRSVRYEGRITRVRFVRQKSKQIEILFLKNTRNKSIAPDKPQTILLSQINIRLTEMRKILSSDEQSMTLGRFRASMQNRELVSYIDQSHGVLRVQKGRILALERDQLGHISIFVLGRDNGEETRESMRHVDPDSIVTFKVEPRQLNEHEKILVAQLRNAFFDRTYVSFLIQDASYIKRFEGWINGVELNTSGEYLIRVDEHNCRLNCGSYKYKLSTIISESFEEKPILIVRKTGELQNKGRAAVRVVAYLEKNDNKVTREVSLSPDLYDELSVFADPQEISGSRLPRELEQWVQPGSELRLYFIGGRYRVRLTVRREPNGSWMLATSGLDNLSISESSLHSDSSFMESRYTPHEQKDLSLSHFFVDELPAARLRSQMRIIREIFIQERAEQDTELTRVKNEWAQSIPLEQLAGFGVDGIGLILHDQGLRFALNRGFFRDQLLPLSDIGVKKLAAIKYLVMNDLVFSPSVKNKYSEVKIGKIYLRRSFTASVSRNTNVFLEYDFTQELIKAMENADIQYVNGEWEPK